MVGLVPIPLRRPPGNGAGVSRLGWQSILWPALPVSGVTRCEGRGIELRGDGRGERRVSRLRWRELERRELQRQEE